MVGGTGERDPPLPPKGGTGGQTISDKKERKNEQKEMENERKKEKI